MQTGIYGYKVNRDRYVNIEALMDYEKEMLQY